MVWGRRGNMVVYGLIALLAVLSLFILFRLRDRFEQGLVERVDSLQRVFSTRALLKSPGDDRISFRDVELEVEKYENRGDFGPITVAKLIGGREHVVYPFYLPALERADLTVPHGRMAQADKGQSWREGYFSAERMMERPLMVDGQRLGSLWVVVNYGPLRTVSFVIWSLGAMLATSLAFLATQFRRQEKVISATTIELEEKRRELVRLERLALAGQLSANILHDLKKPVLNIRNEAVEALDPLDNAPPPGGFEVLLGRIREQADFFLAMLKEAGFDRFVRAEETREYVDINNLLERSVALVRYEQSSVRLEWDIAEDLPPILTDPVRLIQVFSNLVLNAYQAMDGRGELFLTTGREGEQIRIALRDTGPGIVGEKMKHIFEPFYTTKDPGQGTGLGLYIVREILEDMGGSIIVETGTDGTMFVIHLPNPGE